MSEIKHNSGSHSYSDDIIIDYCLGELSGSDLENFENHLLSCSYCSRRVNDYSATSESLVLSLHPVAPPARIKNQIFAAIGKTQKDREGFLTAQTAQRNRFPKELPQRKGIFLPMPLVASLIFALIGSLSLSLILGLNSTDGNFTEVVALVKDDSGNNGGVLLIDTKKQRGRLIIQKLPALPPDQDYQLWIIDSGKRVSASVFDVDSRGKAEVSFLSDLLAKPDVSFGITIEPAGGSPLPTGTRVILGQQNT